jgi:hypothetical protein
MARKPTARYQGTHHQGWLCDDREFETEFHNDLVWKPLEAMSKFAGGGHTQAHHPGRDNQLLVELPNALQIPNLLKSHGQKGLPET